MTLGLQLLLIFQCPGLANPLANFLLCAWWGWMLEEDAYGCGHWLRVPFLDGWTLPAEYLARLHRSLSIQFSS